VAEPRPTFPADPTPPPPAGLDTEGNAVVTAEVALLEKTRTALDAAVDRVVTDYDQELISLRDQIAEARLEDVPPLVQQMERIAARRAELPTNKVNLASPYFGHIELEENARKRDVLIGNVTYVDTERGVRIVDWRDAPVSRLYYRYAEGDEYEEEFGGRTLEGRVLARRSVVIAGGELRRVIAPQGTFARRGDGTWRRLDVSASKLTGGQGTAERPPALEEYSVRRGRLGVRVDGREDRHLPDIPALIDPRQFELISKPSSGLVVIQGGAGSGKTTIGLHRMAYLTFREPRRFSPDKMLVVVFNDALVSYISRVLPGLGVENVQVITYTSWAARQRKRHVPRVPGESADDTPPGVSRMKKHPALLTMIDERVAREAEAITAQIARALRGTRDGDVALAAWKSFATFALAQRVTAASQWLRGEREVSGRRGNSIARDTQLAFGAVLDRVRPRSRDVLWDWAELVTDHSRLREGFARLAPGEFTDAEIASAVRYCTERVGHIAVDRFDEEDADALAADTRENSDVDVRDRDGGSVDERDEARAELDPADRPSRRPRRRDEDDEDDEDDLPEHDPYRALDGVDERERRVARLDPEDDTLLLRLYQRKRGGLRRDKKLSLLYEHVFVDEAQDLSPLELAVLIDCVTPARSITLAGDTAQRLLLDNGFSDWGTTLRELGLSAVAVEPLKIGYRSTREVLEFARAVLGPLADPEPPIATRSGAPVELHRFPDAGAAVGFLSEALRELAIEEPRASVAVVAREPERADVYFAGLSRAEVPRLSRVRAQDFSFKPGVEVTDVRQVKGLEFDYVIMVDVTTAGYPVNDESRHLLHIGATRAAHQLWLIAAGEPSRLLPDEMRAGA
jgi:DNA helicase-2/ATP-dependent DNA helicase PcrA